MKAISTHADAFLVMALYFHQGAGSTPGQAIRAQLGLGQFENIPPRWLYNAKRILAPQLIAPICQAYEQGLNDAVGTTEKQNPFPNGTPEATAWVVGRDKGRQAIQCAPVAHSDFVDSTWPEHGDGGKDAW